MKKRLWIAAMAVIMAGTVTQAEPVVYQSDFTGADLASAGLTQEQFDASSTWILNTTSNRVESDFAGTTDRSTLYTIDSWQNTGGFTLDVTFMHAADGVRFSFGLVDADWTVLADDWVDYHSAYGIGMTLDGSTAAGGDGLAFSDGSASGLLSTDQGSISMAVEHTLSMRVTSTGWSYSLDGAKATTGTHTFDTSKSYRFVANAQSRDMDGTYFSNIAVTPMLPVTVWELDMNTDPVWPEWMDRTGSSSYTLTNGVMTMDDQTLLDTAPFNELKGVTQVDLEWRSITEGTGSGMGAFLWLNVDGDAPGFYPIRFESILTNNAQTVQVVSSDVTAHTGFSTNMLTLSATVNAFNETAEYIVTDGTLFVTNSVGLFKTDGGADAAATLGTQGPSAEVDFVRVAPSVRPDEAHLVVSDANAMKLTGPATIVTGSVELAYGSVSNDLEITAIVVSDESHNGAFSVVTAAPQTLASTAYGTTELDVAFDNSVAGLLFESATGLVTVTWTETGSGVTNETVVPVLRDRVTVDEMMENLDPQLARFPDYSWDKVSRWAYGRKNDGFWTDAEIDIIGSRCKYIWISEGVTDSERFLAAYPENMYCFSAYINLEKAYHNPDPFNPEYYLYGSNGGLATYSTGQKKYNHANPEVREWWVDKISEFAYGEEGEGTGPKSDVIFIDSIQKALRIAVGDYYDYWGNPVSDTYMENAIVPLLETVRDELSEDFILQGNFLRASTTYTEDSNLSYVSNYLHSSYLEGFEIAGDGYAANNHKGIDAVQQAVELGKLICPNFGSAQPYVCTELTLDEMRAKASEAMPAFWASLEEIEQDELAAMYAYFDYKLATFLIMAGEHSYLRFSDEVVVDRAGTDLFQIAPPFPEFDRKLGAPLSDGVRISDTTWEREFEYCKVILNVDGGAAYIDWSHRSDGQTENMALGKPATQISTAYGGVASRANDGNTDGVWYNDSVNHTDEEVEAWWEVDLEAIREIGDIDVWNRTDTASYRTSDFYVLVSTDPFLSQDLDTTLAQPGVTAVYVEGECGTPTSVPINTAGRYVRVQLTATAEKMNMAEVQVWPGTPDNNPPVAIAQSVSVWENSTKAITLSGTDVELETLMALIDTSPSHGTVSLDGNVATYQPATNYFGADSFTFKMMDGSSTGTAATVSITVKSLLMAHWALDEGAGSVATDSSGYGQDGIITNGTWVTGAKGNALAFNGTSSTVTLPASTFSSITNEITIAMWVYGDDTLPKNNSAFYAEDASGNRCLNIHLPIGSGSVYWDAGNSTGYDRINKLATSDQYKGAWNHWVFTKDATTGVMNIYHNGALFETGAGLTKSIGTITNATLGSQITGMFYDGVIDEVRVYKDALAASEVYDLYMDFDTFTVSNFTVGAGNMLEWTALPSQVYHVYWSSNLLSGFTLVGSNVSNGVFIDTTYSAEPAGFYKLIAEPQP